MRFLFYAKTNGVEELFYDSQSGDINMAVASPKLKLEINKAGILEFTILPNHPMYDSFHKLKTYIRVMQDDFEIFRGRVLQIEDSTYFERNIQCEGDLAYLIDSMQYPDKIESTQTVASLYTDNGSQRSNVPDNLKNKFPYQEVEVNRTNLSIETASHESLYDHFVRYITVHNNQMEIEKRFAVGNVTIDNKNVERDFTSTSYRNTKSAFDSDLIKYTGGFLQTRKENGTVYIDYLKEPIVVSSQPIVLGINLVEMQRKSDGGEMFTRLVPIGNKQMTINSVNNGVGYIQNDEGYSKYGAIYRVENFSSASDEAELLRLGRQYMATHYKDDPLNFTITAVDMNLIDGNIDAIQVGSLINVKSDPHGIDLNLMVVSIEYDIQNPENNSYEIGDPVDTLSSKSNTDGLEANENISSANVSAHSASASVKDIEQTVNRHAQSIVDQADGLFSLKAETLKIEAKTIQIEADLLEIKTNVLGITATSVDITATSLNLNNQVILDGSGNSDYDLYVTGNSFMIGTLNVGSWIYGSLDDGNGTISDGVISHMTSVYSNDFYMYYDWDSESGYDGVKPVSDAIISFGEATSDENGVISIPYNTFSTENAGTLTFNIGDTGYYQRAVAAAGSISSAAWSNNTFTVTTSANPSHSAATTISIQPSSWVNGSMTITPTAVKSIDGSPNPVPATLLPVTVSIPNVTVNPSNPSAEGYSYSYINTSTGDFPHGFFSISYDIGGRSFTYSKINANAPWNRGWVDACSDISLPNTSTGNTITFGYPNLTTPDGTPQTFTLTLTGVENTSGANGSVIAKRLNYAYGKFDFELVKDQTPSNTGYASVTSNGVVLAKLSIGDWYTAGTVDGAGSVIPRSIDSINAITLLSTDIGSVSKTISGTYNDANSTTWSGTLSIDTTAIAQSSGTVSSSWGTTSQTKNIFTATSGYGGAAGTASTTVTLTYGNWSSGNMPVHIYADGSTRFSGSVSIPSNVDTNPNDPNDDGYSSTYLPNSGGQSHPHGVYSISYSIGGRSFTYSGIDAGGAWQSGESSGWSAAYSDISLPSTSTGNTITFGYPNSSVNGTPQTFTLTLTGVENTSGANGSVIAKRLNYAYGRFNFELVKDQTPSNAGYASVTSDGVVLAKLSIGDWYTAGANSVSVRKGSWSNGNISFTPSEGTGAGSSVNLSLEREKGTSTAMAKVSAYDGSTYTNKYTTFYVKCTSTYAYISKTFATPSGIDDENVIAYVQNPVVAPTVNVSKSNWIWNSSTNTASVTFYPSSGDGTSQVLSLSYDISPFYSNVDRRFSIVSKDGSNNIPGLSRSFYVACDDNYAYISKTSSTPSGIDDENVIAYIRNSSVPRSVSTLSDISLSESDTGISYKPITIEYSDNTTEQATVLVDAKNVYNSVRFTQFWNDLSEGSDLPTNRYHFIQTTNGQQTTSAYVRLAVQGWLKHNNVLSNAVTMYYGGEAKIRYYVQLPEFSSTWTGGIGIDAGASNTFSVDYSNIQNIANETIVLSTDEDPSEYGYAYVKTQGGTTVCRINIGNWYTAGYEEGSGGYTPEPIVQRSVDTLSSITLLSSNIGQSDKLTKITYTDGYTEWKNISIDASAVYSQGVTDGSGGDVIVSTIDDISVSSVSVSSNDAVITPYDDNIFTVPLAINITDGTNYRTIPASVMIKVSAPTSEYTSNNYTYKVYVHGPGSAYNANGNEYWNLQASSAYRTGVESVAINVGTPWIANPARGYIQPYVTVNGSNHFGNAVKLTNAQINDWGGPVR